MSVPWCLGLQYSGEKLRQALMEQGTFEGMETEVKKWQAKLSAKKTNSAWVTKHYLMAKKHWTKYSS